MKKERSEERRVGKECLRLCRSRWEERVRREGGEMPFIYLFLPVLGLRFCARAFSSCGKRGPLFIAVRGPLTIVASPVAEHKIGRASCRERVSSPV